MSASVDTPPRSRTKFDPEACIDDKKKTIEEGGLGSVRDELGAAAARLVAEGKEIRITCETRGWGTKCVYRAELHCEGDSNDVCMKITNDSCLRKTN